MSNQQQRNINGKDYLVNEKIAVFDLHEKPSSNVAFYGLNYAGRELFVQFKSGSSYVYNEVPDEILNAAMSASSIGSFISATVSKCYQFDKYGYQLVVAAPEKNQEQQRIKELEETLVLAKQELLQFVPATDIKVLQKIGDVLGLSTIY